jgi:hypothetical protein
VANNARYAIFAFGDITIEDSAVASNYVGVYVEGSNTNILRSLVEWNSVGVTLVSGTVFLSRVALHDNISDIGSNLLHGGLTFTGQDNIHYGNVNEWPDYFFTAVPHL